MAATAASWFYRTPETNGYLLAERVNGTFWDNRLGGILLTAVKSEAPFTLIGTYLGADVRMEWEPNKWMRLSTNPASPALVDGLASILRRKPDLRYDEARARACGNGGWTAATSAGKSCKARRPTARPCGSTSSSNRRRAELETKKAGRPNQVARLLFVVVPAGLLRQVGGADLADDRDPDLTGVGHGLLDLAGDVAAEELGGQVVDGLGPDDDADLAPRLQGIALRDAFKRVGNLFQAAHALDVLVVALGAGRRAAHRR